MAAEFKVLTKRIEKGEFNLKGADIYLNSVTA